MVTTLNVFVYVCILVQAGVSGLIKRLSNDKVLPSFLDLTNSRGAPYAAILSFVVVSMSLFLAIFDPADPTGINNFGGVFAISFLSVLVAFATGAIFLKLNRSQLARMVIAKWWQIFLSFCAVFVGLIGNIILTPTIFTLFLAYLSGFLSVCMYMFYRVAVLSCGIWMVSISFLLCCIIFLQSAIHHVLLL